MSQSHHRQGAGPGPSPTYDLLESEYLQYNLSQPEIVAFFSSVTVLHPADEQISPLARHRPLKELIQRQTDEVRHIKQSIGYLFSALHCIDKHQHISELPAPLLDPLYLVFLALLRSIFGPSLQLHFWKTTPPHQKPNPTKLQFWPTILARGE